MEVGRAGKYTTTAACLAIGAVMGMPNAAQAAVWEPARSCNPGPSGDVCITVRTDGAQVRSRMGIEANGSKYICFRMLRTVKIDRFGSHVVSERAPQPGECWINGHHDIYTQPVAIDPQADRYCTEGAWATAGTSPGSPPKPYGDSVCWDV